MWPEPPGAIRRILRDFRTGEQDEIDRNLLDLLVMLRSQLDTTAQVQVISGYCSPKANKILREESSGVASPAII
jgi:uncharacterized protein YcbK (DUF882 family)